MMIVLRVGETGAALPRFDALTKAITRSLNRAVGSVRTQAVRRVSRMSGIKQARVREEIVVVKASFERLRARLVASGNAVPLIHFRARQARAGVTAVAYGGVKKTYKGTFIATMKGGRQGVWRRDGAKGSRRRGERRAVVSGENVGKSYRPELPIVELWGPSVPQTLELDSIVGDLVQFMDDRFRVELGRNLAYYEGRSR